MANGPKNFWTLHNGTFIIVNNYCKLQTKLRLKRALLVICKILGLPVNTLTTDDKYFLFNRENLTQPIQMQLSKN